MFIAILGTVAMPDLVQNCRCRIKIQHYLLHNLMLVCLTSTWFSSYLAVKGNRYFVCQIAS